MQDQPRRLERSVTLGAHLDELVLGYILMEVNIGRALGEHGGLPHEHLAVGRLVVVAQEHTGLVGRSEEHTSELQSLMRISYAVFCLKKKKNKYDTERRQQHTYINMHTLYTQ